MADIARITEVVEPEANALGFDLVRVKFFGKSEAGDGEEPALQIMAERADTGQLVIDDCAALSRRVSDAIDGPFVPGINKYETIIMWGVGIFCLVCLVIARRMLWKGIAAAKNSLNPLQDKLTQYRSSLIRYLVLCEVPALVSIILFMLSGNFIFQVFAAVFLGFMLALAPVRRRVVAALELGVPEQRELE